MELKKFLDEIYQIQANPMEYARVASTPTSQ